MVTHADQVAVDAAASQQSVFESQPQQSKAMVTHAQQVDAAASQQSVFESQPQQSKAAVTHADQVASLAASERSVFESTPALGKTHARAGQDYESESEYE